MYFPPPKLGHEEFRRRCDRLRNEGKPICLRTIDPEFWKYHSRKMQELRTRLAVLLISALIILLSALFLVLVIFPGLKN